MIAAAPEGSQHCQATDRNGNNESALLFSTGAYRGSNTGHLILAKGSIIALSDFFRISHQHSDMLINEFSFPGTFPLYPTAMIFRTGLCQSSPKNGVGKI
jgi:hypothetical protein